MKPDLYKILPAACLALLLFSCKRDIDIPAPAKGSVDVTKYVAIGSSRGAGYGDNALYHEAQVTAYPNLLSQQFKLIGGGEFKQPLVDASSVGIGASLNARFTLLPVTDCAGVTSLAPQPAAATGDLSIFATPIGAQGPFNNMSVPGLKSVTTVYPGYGDPNNGVGNYNPFFTRIASNPQTSSVLSDAATQQPSFFSLSVGNDDVLAYALSGGTQDVITPASGAPGFGFNGSVEAILTTLTAGGAKGVILNVPDLNSLPFFTTIPYNGLMLDQANAAALTAAYTPLGITFQAGANAFIIEDVEAPGNMRKINAGEMLLLSLPQDSLKCAGWGSLKPIPDAFVLKQSEITLIETAITEYNNILKAAATAKNLAFADVNTFLTTAKTGIMYNGIGMNTQYVSGGIFSLDGINLTPRGNALLANEIIKSINSKYGSTIPQVDATKYRSIIFP
jgi:lysophospholipase L1-like esterase